MPDIGGTSRARMPARNDNRHVGAVTHEADEHRAFRAKGIGALTKQSMYCRLLGGVGDLHGDARRASRIVVSRDELRQR